MDLTGVDMSRRAHSTKTSRLPLPVAVTSPPQLAALLAALSGQPAVAVDTESNSLYAYQEQVCLIQFSTPAADYVVDPLAGLDLAPLVRFFADASVQKVFHAAEYDVMCLKRDFGFRFANLFDTMWVARILGWPRVGLADVLRDTFSVRTNKRYQRYNWGKRPLDPQALAYACLDTHYLLPLRYLQADALTQKGRWEEAREIFDQLAATEPAPHSFGPDDFMRVKGAFDLNERERAILREFYAWRDQEARRQDQPPFKVLADGVLIALAQAQPHTMEGLTGVGELKPHQVRRYGRHILQAVERGLRAQPPKPPPSPPRHSEEEVARFEALRAWRKRIAEKRGVEADVIVGNSVLWALAEQDPCSPEDLECIEGLGPWKRKTYGIEMLSVIRDQ
jgi:ribonuclease D